MDTELDTERLEEVSFSLTECEGELRRILTDSGLEKGGSLRERINYVRKVLIDLSDELDDIRETCEMENSHD